jgi:hypothetical protein
MSRDHNIASPLAHAARTYSTHISRDRYPAIMWRHRGHGKNSFLYCCMLDCVYRAVAWQRVNQLRYNVFISHGVSFSDVFQTKLFVLFCLPQDDLCVLILQSLEEDHKWFGREMRTFPRKFFLHIISLIVRQKVPPKRRYQCTKYYCIMPIKTRNLNIHCEKIKF